jgi:BirA family biotin operon repressor/biotin-[acetyl-CoA-carboxylase] ligase
VVRALESQGISAVGLKWPNDIQANGSKLGGILLESRPAGGGRSAVVIGIGINVAMPSDEAAARAIDQPWTSVAGLIGGETDPGLRDRLAAAVLDHLLRLPGRFEADGFGSFRADWQRLDVLVGHEVAVISADGELCGRAEGIDQQGTLRVGWLSASGDPQQQSFNSAEVSVRQAGPASNE